MLFAAACSQFAVGSRRPAARGSLQHDVFEVLLQYGVLDGVEDKADVFCVYGSGEVVEEWLAPVPPFTAERLHQERLREAQRLKCFI